MPWLLHGRQYFLKWHGSETGGVIGQTKGDDQFALVEESATCINDVRYVAFTLVLVGFEQGFAEATDHFGRIIAIEQKRADAVLSQGADTVAKDQPASLGLNGGAAVAKLDQFPRECRFEEHLALIPAVDGIGKHKIDVLVVLPGEHRIKAIDFPGEDGHSFVFGGRTVQANESKEKKVRGLHQLWHHDLSIEGGEGRVVDVTVVTVLETDKPCVLDAVTLRGNGWENDSH